MSASQALIRETPSKNLARDITSLSKGDTKLTVHILTSHDTLDQSDTNECKACEEEEETSIHVLSICRVELDDTELDFLEPKQTGKLPRDPILFWRKGSRNWRTTRRHNRPQSECHRRIFNNEIIIIYSPPLVIIIIYSVKEIGV